jgi:hypothetical protein
MIAHVILFQPRANMTAEERKAVFAALSGAAHAIPSVRSCRIGRRIKHGLPGYEQAMSRNFEYAAILEFDDIAGLREYLTHSAHESVGRFFTTAAEAALAYDYELGDIADAAGW